VSVTSTVRAGQDAWIEAAHPAQNHGKTTYLTAAGVGSAVALVYLKNPAPKGTRVISGKLRLHAKTAIPSGTVIYRQPLKTWKQAQVTWNKPPATAAGAASITVGTTIPAGGWLELDVTTTLQSMVNGQANYGWRIYTGGATKVQFYAFDSGKGSQLVATYAYRPSKPTNLTPNGTYITTAAPTVSWGASDSSGKAHLAKIQVQVDPTGSSSPAWDSGLIVSSVPEMSLLTQGYPGLASGASTKWRCLYVGPDGDSSGWSDWATITRAALPTVTITSPGDAPNDFVTALPPTVTWTSTGQARWQVLFSLASNRNKILWDSGIRTGTDQALTPPAGVITDSSLRYTVEVRVFDALQRAASAGESAYGSDTADFGFAYDATVPPVTALTVSQPTGTSLPVVDLQFTRATAPDSFSIERNGHLVELGLDPAVLQVSAGTYQWRDWTAPPNTDLVYRIVPVVGAKSAATGPTETIRIRTDGTWIVDPTSGEYFNVFDEDVSGLSYPEDSEETPVKGTAITRKISSMRGLEGPITGRLGQSEYDPRTTPDQLADVWSIKGLPYFGGRRLIVNDLNVPVFVGKIGATPSSQWMPHIPLYDMTFYVWQNGELPYEVVI